MINPSTLFTLNPFIRFDRSQYFPSANPLSDLPATLSQSRYLTNIGFRSDVAYSHGIHNAKFGGSYWHTLLRESFNIALTDPAYNAVCLDSSQGAVTDPKLLSEKPVRRRRAISRTRTSSRISCLTILRAAAVLYAFHGDADVKELAFYVQDSINLGRLTLNPGVRYDRYNGLSQGHQLQPRFGLAYRTPWTNTIFASRTRGSLKLPTTKI